MKDAELKYWKKGRFLMNSGKTIIIELDIWLVPGNKQYLYPNGLKFGWIACDKDNPEERLLVDYNTKKGFHYHLDDQPIIKLEWISLSVALNFFTRKFTRNLVNFKKILTIMNKNKTFTFKYDPTASLEKMGQELQEAVRTSKPNLQLHQISFANIEDITNEFISPRPKLFACLVENKPQSLYQLAKLLKRDYANVYKDIKSLVAMGIIKLEKNGERIIPIPLYDKILFDFQVNKVFPQTPLERMAAR